MLGSRTIFALFVALTCMAWGPAQAATVVALGANNTFGKGVARNHAYPAQIEAILRAKGMNVRVVNAGINGDTTGGMLRQMDRATSKGTDAVIIQPAVTMPAKAVKATARPTFPK